MAHELWCINESSMINITPLIGSISWRSNMNELGEQLSFDIAFNDDRYFPKNPVDLGSLISLKNGVEVNRTIVITEERNGRGAMAYNCFDYGFYLNKSTDVFQFNNLAANVAIEKIVNKAGIPIGHINCPGVPIDKIYRDKVHSEIIKDILEIILQETGEKYVMEVMLNRFYVEKLSEKIISPTFRLASNIAPVEVIEAISSPNRKRSIEEMKNSVKVVLSDEDSISIAAQVKNQNLINKYGLLQQIVSVDKDNIAQAKVIAENMLRELGKIFEENSITVPGHDEIRAGRVIQIEEHITGMSGKYLIENAEHTIKNGIHMCTLGLGVI